MANLGTICSRSLTQVQATLVRTTFTLARVSTQCRLDHQYHHDGPRAIPKAQSPLYRHSGTTTLISAHQDRDIKKARMFAITVMPLEPRRR